MVRVVLGGNNTDGRDGQSGGFGTFTPNENTDSYVKLVFPPSGVDVSALETPLTMDSFSALPPEQQPTVRTYTVRRVDAERGEITIDFVVHGEHGVAGPWAA